IKKRRNLRDEIRPAAVRRFRHGFEQRATRHDRLFHRAKTVLDLGDDPLLQPGESRRILLSADELDVPPADDRQNNAGGQDEPRRDPAQATPAVMMRRHEYARERSVVRRFWRYRLMNQTKLALQPVRG